MNAKLRVSVSIAAFLFLLSGSLIALNNLNSPQPLQYAKAQATDPTAPTTPGIRLPTATSTGTTTGATTGTSTGTSTTGTTSTSTTTGTTAGSATSGTTTSSTSNSSTTGGVIVTPPPTPNISNAGLLDGVIPSTNTTSTTTATTAGSAGSSSTANQAAVNTTNTVRTGGLATTGILLLVAAGVGIYYYQKNHKQSKFALKMSEKKIGGRK